MHPDKGELAAIAATVVMTGFACGWTARTVEVRPIAGAAAIALVTAVVLAGWTGVVSLGVLVYPAVILTLVVLTVARPAWSESPVPAGQADLSRGDAERRQPADTASA